MKVLILVDLLNNWAIHNRAKAIKKFLPYDEIEIRSALDNKANCLNGHDKFDVIHFNFTYGITNFTDFILKHAHKCLITIVNERSMMAGHGVDLHQFNRILDCVDHKTALNHKIATLSGSKYIPNGIDAEIFPKFKRPIIGYSGSNTPNKQVDIIYQACKELGLEFKTAMIRNKQISNIPDLQHEQMTGFYNSIDVFVHAGSTEGFSNTILEALACNVPVLMTKQGAWQEFEGWVEFVMDNVEDIKRALRKYTGRDLIVRRFLWDYIVPEYRNAYEKIKVMNEDHIRV